MNFHSGNILLIGYRGTGKSSVGKKLAGVLGMDFLDMDRLLVEEEGFTIARIVQEKGWPYFRQQEKHLLQRLSRNRGQVIATGGGVVLDPENRLLLKKMGLVIWLTADIDVMVERLKQDPAGAEQRPAFSERDLREETGLILQERIPLYEEVSDFTLDTSNLSIGETVDEIVGIIHQEMKKRRKNEQKR